MMSNSESRQIMSLDQLLSELREILQRERPTPKAVYGQLELILQELIRENTDENCRKVDSYISTQIDDAAVQNLPDALQEIIFDMGGALHDTHSNPDIAKNFFSTPEQLLERLKALKGDYADP